MPDLIALVAAHPLLIAAIPMIGVPALVLAIVYLRTKRAPGPDRDSSGERAPGSLPLFMLCSSCEAKQREGRLRVYGCDWCAIVSGVTRYEVIAFKDPEREREAYHALAEKRWGKLTRMCQWPITKPLLAEMAVERSRVKAGEKDQMFTNEGATGSVTLVFPTAQWPAPLAIPQAAEGEYDGIKVGYRRVFKDGVCAGWVRQDLPAEGLLAAIKPWGPGAYHVTGPKPALVTVGEVCTGPGTGTWSGVGRSGDLRRVKAPKPGDPFSGSWVDPEMRRFDGQVYALDHAITNGFWSLVGAGGWVFHIDWLEPVTT